MVEISDNRGIAAQVRELVRRHNRWFEDCIPMIASENLLSPLAREMLISDFCDRYAEGQPGRRYYQGLIYIDEVERICTNLAKKLFRCCHADVRPISGTTANIATLFALTNPGDIITTCALTDGAHISTAKFGAVGIRGVNTVTYPFDTENMNIDVESTIKVIKSAKPKVALFGLSVFLFPTPLKELKPVLDEVGAHVWYDGAHVLGLIAGGKFQDPLHEGAHVMTGSTHKTLPGPQHGIILSDQNDEKFLKKLESGVFPGVVSNHHLHAMAALAITLAESLEFGAEYAGKIIENAKSLAQALYERGFPVFCEHLDFTKSHTILVDVSKFGGGAQVAKLLEQANIIVNKNLLPHDDPKKPMNPSGIRLGTQELTRLGMDKTEMVQIAELMKKLIIDGKNPNEVKQEVRELKANFKLIKYCFAKNSEAYKYYKLVEEI